MDALGLPPESYEHDMKLWWPHNEILISSLMLYRDTGKEEYLDWFFKTLDYCKTYLADEEYGEWYGYLRRDGKTTEPPCKGSTFKGPFHMPRCMSMLDQMLTELLEKHKSERKIVALNCCPQGWQLSFLTAYLNVYFSKRLQ